MTMRLGAFAALSLLLLSGCTREPQEYLDPPAPPRIESFVASATAIKPGEQVTLTFKARDAAEAQILDQNGQLVEFDGTATEGTAVVAPEQTSFYVLRVTGPGGRESGMTRIEVGDKLSAASVIVVPPLVESGDEVQVIWTARDATSVTLVDGSGETLSVDPAAGAGMVSRTVTKTTTFKLTATSPNVSAPLISETLVKVLPTSRDFTASPRAVQKGEPMTLSFASGGEGSFTIAERSFGDIAEGSLSASGSNSFTWTPPATFANGEAVIDGTPLFFTLKVTSTDPASEKTHTVSAKIGSGPVINAFKAPAYLTEGQQLELSWSVEGAVKLRILRQGLSIYEPAPGSPELDEGTLNVGVLTQNETYSLEAEDSDGNVSRTSPQTITLVPVPTVTLTAPASPTPAGSAATLAYTSTGADRLVIRFKDGPQLESRNTGLGSGNVSVVLGTTASLIAEAFNSAGFRVATAPVVVQVSPLTSGTAELQPSPAFYGDTLTLNVDLTAQGYSSISGMPTQTVRDSTAAQDFDFLDLTTVPEAKVVDFGTQTDDGIVKLAETQGFVFPFVGTVRENFWVSTNGFVAFENVGALATHQNLSAANTAPALLAPFWMNLAIPEVSTYNPNPKVLYFVEGSVFPRTLTVQWNDVSLSFTAARFTFQVQISEAGSVQFLYKTLDSLEPNYAGGEQATIGVNLQSGLFSAQFSEQGVAKVSTGLSLEFMNPLNDQAYAFSMPAVQSGTLRLFGVDSTQAPTRYVGFSLAARVFRARDVLVNEVMATPDATLGANASWVELFNPTSEDIDISGLVLSTTNGAGSFVIGQGKKIPARGFFLLAGSDVSSQNGGVTGVNEAYGTLLPFDLNADTLSIGLGTNVIDSLSWSAATETLSITSPESAISSTGALLSCPETATYGSPQHTGSPGAANRVCFPYRMASIPVAFQDISGTGTQLTVSSNNLSVLYQSLDVSSAPITLWGVANNSIQISGDGYVLPEATPSASTSFNFAGTTNPLRVPDSTSPNGAIAIFGDDLDDTVSPYPVSGMYYQRIAPGENPAAPAGHWIVQWSHMEQMSKYDDMNFQVKFFDDGAIEFHYAQMEDGNTAGVASGSSATIWLENLAGDAALSLGTPTSSPVIASDTAYRFTPVNP